MICSKNKWDALIKMGKKICEILKEKEVGSIGIGAMIVFIAMVLVAGIAASVLIQTSTRLETQAMRSGQETTAEVATGIAVEDIFGHYSSSLGYVNLLAISVRPRAGSEDVDLSTVVLELSDSTTKNLIVYNSGFFTDTDAINGDMFQYADYPANAVTFGLIVLEDADDSISTSANPVVNRGDHIVLGVNASAAFSGLSTRKNVFGQVISEAGAPGIIAFTTPAAYNDIVIELQ